MDASIEEIFHLFGDLCVSDPSISLLSEDQEPVSHAISLIHLPAKSHWDLDFAHQRLVSEDIAWWKARDVDRPGRYIVRPSGSIDASVACVLFNPTFSVKDPCYGETFDPSNATMNQLQRAGFNPENTLFVDQIARRDVSPNVELVYPEDLWQIHERFLRELWDNMRALVVICWGSAVRKRLLGTPKKPGWFRNFEVLKLWGRYNGVEVFLELSANRRSMKRFVLFVKHPSYFFYIQSDMECARKLRRRQGRPQDLALEVAAKLGQITIEPQFYELSPKLRVNLAVPHAVTRERERWKGEAAAQLQRAFPAAILSQEGSNRIRGPRMQDKKVLDEIATLLQQSNMGKVHVKGLIWPGLSRDTDDIEIANITQRDIRLQKINSFWNIFKVIIEESGTLVGSRVPTAEDIESYLTTMEEVEDMTDWQDLPGTIVTLIHDQAGLRFNSRPISSRQDLERAYRLLHKRTPGYDDAPEKLGIPSLAISVLLAYGRKISRDRQPQIDELLVLRRSPYDTLARKCSGCDQLVLDDPFPYWCKYEPERYVTWSGNPGCPCKYASLKPFYDQVKWAPAKMECITKEALEGAHDRKAKSSGTWLIRTEAERGGLPGQVEVKCPSCPRTKLVDAKWTIETGPRILVPRLRCLDTKDGANKGCGNKGDWLPVKRFQIIRQPQIAGLWSRFANKGCILSDYPRDGSVIFADRDIAYRIAKLKELKLAQERT